MTLHETNPLAQDGAVSGTQRGWRSGSWHFLRGTHGGATTIMASMAVAVTIGAAVIVVDHVWLLDQRDVLKLASDAAAVATTIQLERSADTLTDDELNEALAGIARTYVELNMEYLGEDKLERAKRSLKIETKSDRTENTVDVEVSADLGGTLLARHIPIIKKNNEQYTTGVKAQVESIITPIEVALAIDVSGSMGRTIGGSVVGVGQKSRMTIVREGAKQLVSIVKPSADNKIAIGIVPWSSYVRLHDVTKTEWTSKGWAVYPRSRHYAMPYYCIPNGRCTVATQDDLLPATPAEEWLGCLDEHRSTGANHAAHVDVPDWFTAPSVTAFAQSLYPALYAFAYNCISAPVPVNFLRQDCYGASSLRHNVRDDRRPQPRCTATTPTIFPLSTEVTHIDAAIDALQAVGAHTYSTLGVLWGQRLLTHEWRSIWGNAVHPVDKTLRVHKGTAKVIVLLTDGEDNHCGFQDPTCTASNMVGIVRTDACTAAKAAGTKIYVVAAMHPNSVSNRLAATLRECSSASDDPDNNYVFINNSDETRMKETFVRIAEQLQAIRRVH